MASDDETTLKGGASFTWTKSGATVKVEIGDRYVQGRDANGRLTYNMKLSSYLRLDDPDSFREACMELRKKIDAEIEWQLLWKAIHKSNLPDVWEEYGEGMFKTTGYRVDNGLPNKRREVMSKAIHNGLSMDERWEELFNDGMKRAGVYE